MAGWTEPPGRLPSCARPPLTLPLGRGFRLSSPQRVLSERLSPHGFPKRVAGLSAKVRGRSSTACSGLHATPARHGLEQDRLAACLACARYPSPVSEVRANFSGSYPRSDASPCAPRGASARPGPLYGRSRSRSPAACSGLHATPVLCGRTEPPGRLPACARLPRPRTSGFSSPFPVLTRFPAAVSPRGSRPSIGPLYAGYAGVAPRRAWGLHAPLSVWSRTAPPGRLHPAPGLPSLESRPRAPREFPRRLGFPSRGLSPHGSRTRAGLVSRSS